MRVYKIGTAARLTGLEVATLRNWEKRYRLVVASRAEGGQRLYSREQIQQLRLLKRWVEAGLSAGEAHARLRTHVDRLGSPAETGQTRRATDPVSIRAARVREQAAAIRRDSAAYRDRHRAALATLFDLVATIESQTRETLSSRNRR